MINQKFRSDIQSPYTDLSFEYSLIHSKTRRIEGYVFNKLKRLDGQKNYEQSIFEDAKIQISRVFGYLQLPNQYKERVFQKFKAIYLDLLPGSKYRSPDKLVPFSVFYVLRSHDIIIKKSEVLEISNITREEFRKFTYTGLKYFPEYFQRDKKKTIIHMISDLTRTLQLGFTFHNYARKLLEKLWEILKDAKDTLIAGVIATLTALCIYSKNLKLSHIAHNLGLGSGTIQTKIKEKIIPHFKISGFKSLKHSADIIKERLLDLN